MFKVFKSIGWFFKENKSKYILLALLLITISFLTMVTPVLVGQFVDKIATSTLNMNNFVILISLIFILPLLVFVFNKIFHYNMNYFGQVLAKTLRLNYIKKMFVHDSKIFEEYSKGELISRLSNDMPSITSVATTVFTDFVYCATLIIFCLVVMTCFISLKLTIVAFLIIPITFIVLNAWRKHMRKYYEIHRHIYAEFYDKTLESIEGTRVVRAFAKEDADIAKNHVAMKNDIKSWTKIVRFENMFVPMFDTVISISTFLTYFYGSYLVINSQITPGQLVTFSMFINMLIYPIMTLANVYNFVSQADIGTKRYYEVMNKEPQVADHHESEEIFNFNSLEFKNVNFKYPFDDHPTIKNINLTLHKGDTIGIVGPTGSGKSTLIRQLLREFHITDGQIKINDKPIEKYKIDSIRGLIGYVPQEHILFRGTVKKNLMIGDPDASLDLQTWAIQVAAFENDLSYMKEGLTTRIGERGSGLSGGQKQRLSIARAIIKEPEILILDDSLSAVDGKTEKTIVDNLKNHRQDKTNIIISHRFSVIKQAKTIYVLDKGKIIDQGSHDELIARPGWYQEQFNEQTKGNDEKL